MPGVVLARIIYRNDSRRSLNPAPLRGEFQRSNRCDRCVSQPGIHPHSASFIGRQEGELKPAGVSSTLPLARRYRGCCSLRPSHRQAACYDCPTCTCVYVRTPLPSKGGGGRERGLISSRTLYIYIYQYELGGGGGRLKNREKNRESIVSFFGEKNCCK